uniref:G-protein coupled receptors family 1 profile domain-containing protein n=1 Tax=Strigamia maritima TaxID=126957 RepID=T1IYN8_STRMM
MSLQLSTTSSLWLQDNKSYTNDSQNQFPPELQFGEHHLVSIVTYSVLMVISGIGNLSVLVSLVFRRRKKKSLVDLMLIHLAVGDLLVTFVMMPLEIAWAATVSWWAGDAMCRIFAFFRTFGLFLSSFVLVCISIDRYFAVLHPMAIYYSYRRGKLMLIGAWIMSTICSIPQIIVFHVERHGQITWFEQCVTFNSFPSRIYELAYYMFGMIAMYGLPLVVIIVSYGAILIEISMKSHEYKEQVQSSALGECRLRRSGFGNLSRARTKTLKMTVLIVAVFVMCWTPYYVMCLWYWFAPESAKQVDPRIQKALFLFASSNSCMNPIVYGMFSFNCTLTLRPSTREEKRSKYLDSHRWSERTVVTNNLLDVESQDDPNGTCIAKVVTFPASMSTKESQDSD